MQTFIQVYKNCTKVAETIRKLEFPILDSIGQRNKTLWFSVQKYAKNPNFVCRVLSVIIVRETFQN